MKKFFRRFSSKDEYKRLFGNIRSLFFLQGMNHLFPLLTFPYLVRVLGVEKFGLLAFASTTIAYFTLLVDFGFNLSATRKISLHRENSDKLSEVFSSVMVVKVVLFCIAFVLLSVMISSFDKFRNDALIYYLSFGIVAGYLLFPQWIFQGLEEINYITKLNILAKLIFTGAIFLLVHKEEDYWKVPLLNSLGFIIAGVWAQIIVKRFGIDFSWRRVKFKKYILDSLHIFISNLSISVYTLSITFILGIFTNNLIVGYYSAAEKLIGIVKSFLSPVSQALYPYISQKAVQSKEKTLFFIGIITSIIGVVTLLIGLIFFFLADDIVLLILGKQYEPSMILVKIMAFLPFLVGMSNMFGIQTMLNFDRKKEFTRIIVGGGVISLILSFILIPLSGAIGAAVTLVVVESYITIAMFIYLERSDISILKVFKDV